MVEPRVALIAGPMKMSSRSSHVANATTTIAAVISQTSSS